MEKIIQNKEIINTLNHLAESYTPDLSKDSIVYLPVRHHSPIVAHHTIKLIENYQPSLVLIEGPSNINAIKHKLFTENAKMPLAFYSISTEERQIEDEETGKMKKETVRDAVYYPFAEFSPEYIAMQKAQELDIEAEFIDLHYLDLKHYYLNYEKIVNDNYIAYSQYIQLLLEKLGLKDFNELWEDYFETNYFHVKSEQFISDFYSFCYYSRKTYDLDTLIHEGNIPREIYMASKIKEASKTHKKILVITGGFHTPSLMALVNQDKALEFKLKTKGSIDNYIVPYSYERIDERSGYKSGIIFPSYQNDLLRSLNTFKENSDFNSPYEENIIQFIHKLHKELRKGGESGTIVNKIEAIRVMNELRDLRDKKSLTTREMIDAIITSYAKGEDNINHLMTALNKVLTGKKRGYYPYTKEDSPILIDFHEQLQKNKLELQTTAKRIEIYPAKTNAQKKKSMLLHKLIFLDVNFAHLIVKNYKQKGQYNNNNQVYASSEGKGNFLNDSNTYLAELWEYSLQNNTYESLIEASLYGATVNEATLNKFEDLWGKALSFDYAISLYINMLKLEIQVNHADKFIELKDILENEMKLASLVDGFSKLSNYMKVEKLSNNPRFDDIYNSTFNKIIKLLHFIDTLSEDEEDHFSKQIKTIYSIILDDEERLEEFLEVLKALRLKLYENTQTKGSIEGVLYNSNELSEEDILTSFRQIIHGVNNGINTATYLKGVFLVSREIFMMSQDFIHELNQFFITLSEEEFLEIIPSLKQAFTFFTPSEQGKIAKNIADVLHLKQDFIESKVASNEEILGSKLNGLVEQFLLENKLIQNK